MFYLKEFSKLFKTHFILMSILSISVAGFVTSVHQRDWIKSEFALNQKTKDMPYFNALVSDKVNLDSIRRKMMMLPGVFAVSVAEDKGLQNEVGHIKRNFGSEIISELSALNMKRLKIQLDEGIHVKNQNLVKEYLTRLVGDESLTVGTVKTPRKVKLKEDDSLVKLLNYLDLYIICFFMSMLAISIWLLLKPVNNQAYIVEKFQRKNKVNIKIMLSGLVVLAGLSLLFNYIAKTDFQVSSIATLAYIFILPVMFLMSKKLNFKV